MSLDFPNRKDWLAVRHTNRHSLVVEFASTVVFSKGTFNAGRNAEKRKAGKKGAKQFALVMDRDNKVVSMSSAKVNSTERMNLLANRRLRQRSLAA